MENVDAKQLDHISIPLVSVCVQTYQHSNFIAQCLESILMQQTDFPFEVIVGEDESSDGTRNICIQYAEKYPETIRLFLRSRADVIYINGRATGRYNFIENLKAAKGKYIAFCEGDDYWTDPEKLKKQVNFLENNSDYSLTFHNATMIDSSGRILKESCVKRKSNNDGDFKDAFLRMIPSASVMFRNYLIDKFPPEFYKVLNVDRLFWALLAQHGGIKFMNEIKPSVYRIHAGGMWSSQFAVEKFVQRVKIMETLLSVLKPAHKRTINHYLSVRQYRLAASYIEYSYSFKKIFTSYLVGLRVNAGAKNKAKAFLKGHKKIASSLYKLIKKKYSLSSRR